jgi:hypothetical protein
MGLKGGGGRMTKQFKWFPDEGSFTEDLTTSDGLSVNDGYSQWNLIRGRDFELSNEIEKVHPSDFRYVSVIKRLQGGGSVGRSSDLDFQFLKEPVDFRNFNDRGTQEEADEMLITRLPLRKSSIQETYDPKNKSLHDYPLPQDVDPNKMVIVGVIDDAINIAHKRFRTSQGHSRVDFAWVQDAKAGGRPTVPFGREWARIELEDVIAANNGDDDACMQALDIAADPSDHYRPSPILQRASHGTFVADLAAGYDHYADDALNRRLITVQIPALASQDTSGAALISSVMGAADFIFERALTISKTLNTPIPVVLNFSYGLFGGPRSGLHVLERALRMMAETYKTATEEEVCEGAPFVVVLPAGNSHLSRTHASSLPATGVDEDTSLPVNLQIKPEDRTSSFMEYWLPDLSSGEKITLEIEHPGDKTRHEIEFDPEDKKYAEVLAYPDETDPTKPDLNTVIARTKVDEPNFVPDASLVGYPIPHYRLLVSIAPTLVLDSKRVPSPHGCWKIKATARLPGNGQIRAWIQRDEAVSGFGIRGQQPYFDDDVYEEQRFDHLGDYAVASIDSTSAGVRRNGTVSGIATNLLVKPNKNLGKAEEAKLTAAELDTLSKEPLIDAAVTVGGYNWQTDAAAIYSAAGSYFEIHKDKPDKVQKKTSAPLVMAPTDVSRITRGIPASGSRGEYLVTANGTSVAAPQVTRFLADVLSETPMAERKDFDAIDCIKHHKKIKEPPRPGGPDNQKEIASSRVIRKERVETGLLPPGDELEEKLQDRACKSPF